jgi:hypothetical protein
MKFIIMEKMSYNFPPKRIKSQIYGYQPRARNYFHVSHHMQHNYYRIQLFMSPNVVNDMETFNSQQIIKN